MLLDLIDLQLHLRHPLELHVKLASHLIDNLASFVEQVDDAIEFFTRNLDPARLRDARQWPRSAWSGWHYVRGLCENPRILPHRSFC